METAINQTHSPISHLLKEEIAELNIRFQQLRNEVKKVIVGQEHIVEFILISLLCDGHILLEGVPGVAKTTIIKTITDILNLSFKRIQFTPDLLPSDLIGTLIYNQKTADFETKKGPIFANLILADEINRAPAKVQSALLEAMQERQVTIGNQTFALDRPFLVFATQNPLEHDGTYRLPEAQVDRFMFKILIDYPTFEEEKEIIRRSGIRNDVTPIFSKEEILVAQKCIQKIYCDDLISNYIVQIITATRSSSKFKKYILNGASPRATIALDRACRARAFLKKRNYVIPDDVKEVAPAILRHRITLTFEAEAENYTPDYIIKEILNTITTP